MKMKKSEKGRTSIQSRIQKPIVRMLGFGLATMGLLSSVLIFVATTNTLKQTLRETANIAAERVSKEIMDYVHIAYETGCTAILGNGYASMEDKQSILQQKVDNYNIISCDVYDVRGNNVVTGESATSEPFYQAAMNGEIYISKPVVNGETGEVYIIIAAPLWKSGIADTDPIGAVRMVPDTNLLNEIVESISISDNSDAFMIDGTGTYVASYDKELVKAQYNILEASASDNTVKKLAAIVEKMIVGEQGIDTCIMDHSYKYIAYAPIEGTDGWSLAIGAAVNDFSFYTLLGVVIILICTIGGILVAIRISHGLSQKITSPIIQCEKRLQLLSQGDLHSEVPAITEKDETGRLAEATESIVGYMKTIIEDVNYLLDCMANNNFDISTRTEESYIGDFREIILSIRKINRSLSSTLLRIDESANQVASAAEQMSLGAGQLAEGSTDQSAAVEELVATVESLTTQMRQGASQAKATSVSVKELSEGAKQGNEQIDSMTEAMAHISDKSNQIRNIITTIEDIANQTNLLSLNASIEAARAGEAGRGFAVVASEIRHLAEQSEKAVTDTRVLIEAALSEVDNGTITVQNTSTTLSSIITGLEDIAQAVLEMSHISMEQTESMEQVKGGINQIATVVESNSATAQETSATSEELAAQADQLNSLVAQFSLRKI